ncbi:MAG: stage II sporulation protein M [bacterium]
MSQARFEEQNRADWEAFEHWLSLSVKERKALTDYDASRAYRSLAHQLSLAQSRHYGINVIDRLRDLVFRGHQALYHPVSQPLQTILRFIGYDFPVRVRQEWRAVLLAALLFFGPLLGMLAAIQHNPSLVYSMVSEEQAMEFETLYSPENHLRLGREREASSDIFMFGFYIKNNTSIGFQTFAGGLLAGLGTVFFLVFNGLSIGTVAGHLTHLGYIDTFWGFVAGHSAFELTAIVLSGAAGLLLGAALWRPGRRTRAESLRYNAKRALTLVFGAAGLFLLAAFVEAFWSSLTWPKPEFKYAIGILLWALLLSYLLLTGRDRER